MVFNTLICDHAAYRTNNRAKTVDFLCRAFGYRVQEEFEIPFDDEGKDIAKCTSLECIFNVKDVPRLLGPSPLYQLPIEFFVSEGSPGSIVDNWVRENGNGLHHIAYLTENVEETMKEWIKEGFAEFSTEKVLKCEGLTQIFTKKHPILGHVIELIERPGGRVFCKNNVRQLMIASKGD